MRVLFLTHRLPYAPNRGDRVRAYHLLRHLQTIAEVDLVSLVHDSEEAAHLDEVRGFVKTVTGVRAPRMRNLVRSGLALTGSRPLSHVMLDGPDLQTAVERAAVASHPDVVLAFCTGIAHAVVRPPLDAMPLVLDMVDVDSAKWAALAASAHGPRSWIYGREARLLARFEVGLAHRAVATLLTTDAERNTLRAAVPEARIEVVQNGVDAAALHPPTGPASSQTVVFCGVMNYAPNEEGAIWLAEQVWPRVRRARPEARLELVGSSPTPLIRDLASPEAGIIVTGYVQDVRPHLWGAAVSAAPLLTARGIQNKVLEATAAGLPSVVTPAVNNGLPAEVRAACRVADGADAFAEAIVDLLRRSPDERRAVAARADIAAMSWPRRLAPLQAILTSALRRDT